MYPTKKKKLVQVVDAAQAALVQVIFTNRQFKDKSGMPKDLLQSCLRPVLKNLTHIQKLSLPLLQGLSRLLYLLSNWFNVTLGDKLFGYLRQWTEPAKLQALPEPKVIEDAYGRWSRGLSSFTRLNILKPALAHGSLYCRI